MADVAAAAGVDPLELICGGEDYELLVAMPAGAVEEAIALQGETGIRLTGIGSVEGAGEGPDKSVRLLGASGPLQRYRGHRQRR